MQITDKDLQQFRERAKTELQSNGAVGRLAWDAVVNALCNEVEELRKDAAPGNAAALREALERFVVLFDRGENVTPDEAYWCANKAIAALAAPARNCDRFATADKARAAFEAEHSRCIVRNLYTATFDWLFAPAREGGAE